MRVCFVAFRDFRLFPRAFNEIETLVNQGFAVEVVGFDKSRKMPLKEKHNEVQLFRARPKFWIDAGPLNILDFFPAFLAVFSESLKRRADIYHCHDFVSLLVGALIKIISNKKLVYDAYENWPELAANSPNFRGISRLVWAITTFIERLLVRCCDSVLTIDSANGMLLRRLRKYNNNVQVLLNVPKLKFQKDEDKRKELMEKYKNHSIIFYLGSISKDKGLLKSVEAVNVVRKEIPNVKLLIAGGPALPYQNEIDKKEVLDFIKSEDLEECVEFLGWVPYSSLPDYLCLGKVGLALYQPNPWLIKQSRASTKLFLYMLASVPVVVSNFPIKEIVEVEECGIAVDPTNPTEIANAIIYLLRNPQEAQNMGERGRKAVKEKYNWENMEKKLVKAYQFLLND